MLCSQIEAAYGDFASSFDGVASELNTIQKRSSPASVGLMRPQPERARPAARSSGLRWLVVANTRPAETNYLHRHQVRDRPAAATASCATGRLQRRSSLVVCAERPIITSKMSCSPRTRIGHLSRRSRCGSGNHQLRCCVAGCGADSSRTSAGTAETFVSIPDGGMRVWSEPSISRRFRPTTIHPAILSLRPQGADPLFR